MRQSQAAYAIIKHQFPDTVRYLLQLNIAWNNRFNFISGHMESVDGNNFKKTMIREIEEELTPIKYEKEFEVQPISDKQFRDTAHSLSVNEITDYTFYLFHISFLLPVHKLYFLWNKDNSINKWFTENELIEGKGKHGESITRFPVPQIIKSIPEGLTALPDSFTDFGKNTIKNDE